MNAPIVSASTEDIDRIWRQRWGLPIATLRRNYEPGDVEGLLLVRDSEPQGLITWARSGADAELVTLDAFQKGQGAGTRLLCAAEERLSDVTRIVLTTTNDNLRAVSFYLKRGYRLVRIERDAMKEVRRLKPNIPERGQSGILIQDMWELEKRFEAESRPPHHGLTILAVPDVERSAAFYRAAFGYPIRAQVPVYVEFELPDGRGLGLYQAGAFAYNTGEPPAPPPAKGTTSAEIYFYCEDLDAAIARMQDAGARPLSAKARRPWGDDAAYFADPDGNVLVLARPVG